MPNYSVILPAAGSSSRFQGFPQKKPFIDLAGIPVWRRTVNTFASRPDVCQIQLVLAESDIDAFTERFGDSISDIQLVVGGASRAESVRNAIDSVDPSADYIAVHDAARPLVTSAVIDSVFRMAHKTGAAIPVLPVTSTVKQTNDTCQIVQTVDRTQLRLAQTPQTFASDVLSQAYANAAARLQNFTDDASLVEAFGHPIHVTEGSWKNIKITTGDDYQLAQLILLARDRTFSSGTHHSA